MNLKFKNRKILIFGGSSGIGKSIADAFVKHGGKIAVASSNVSKGKKIKNKLGRNCDFFQVDVTNEDSLLALTKRLRTKYKYFDVIVNCVGVYYPLKEDFLTINTSDVKNIINTNYIAAFFIMKYTIPFLFESKGSFINIASRHGLVPNSKTAIYGSSKSAMIMLTKSASLKFANKGLRINTICPGTIKTKKLIEAFDGQDNLDKYIKEKVPLNRCGTPEEVANLVLFLSSPENSYITGGVYTIDGGSSLL